MFAAEAFVLGGGAVEALLAAFDAVTVRALLDGFVYLGHGRLCVCVVMLCYMRYNVVLLVLLLVAWSFPFVFAFLPILFQFL